MKINLKKILLLTGIIALLATTGCIVFPGRHHTEVVVPVVPPPVVVEPERR